MDRGAWQATVHRVSKSRTRLRDFHNITESLCCTLETNTALSINYTLIKNFFKHLKNLFPRELIRDCQGHRRCSESLFSHPMP